MGDNYCDSVNNRAFCNYDGGDCCQSTVKTKKVSGIVEPGKEVLVLDLVPLINSALGGGKQVPPPMCFSHPLPCIQWRLHVIFIKLWHLWKSFFQCTIINCRILLSTIAFHLLDKLSKQFLPFFVLWGLVDRLQTPHLRDLEFLGFINSVFLVKLPLAVVFCYLTCVYNIMWI